jgi:hypothetical protein
MLGFSFKISGMVEGKRLKKALFEITSKKRLFE